MKIYKMLCTLLHLLSSTPPTTRLCPEVVIYQKVVSSNLRSLKVQDVQSGPREFGSKNSANENTARLNWAFGH